MLSMSTKFIAHFLRIYAQLFYHAAVRIICVFLYTFSWKYMQKDSGDIPSSESFAYNIF